MKVTVDRLRGLILGAQAFVVAFACTAAGLSSLASVGFAVASVLAIMNLMP